MVVPARVDEVVSRALDHEALGRHGGLDARDHAVAQPAGVGAGGGDGERFGGRGVTSWGHVGDGEGPCVREALAGCGADGGYVVEGGDGVDVAAPEFGAVADGHLGGGVSALALDFAGVVARFVVVRAGLHAGFEADAELVRGGVGVGFAVGGGFAGGDPV